MPNSGLTDAVSTGLATLAVLLAGALALLALLALAWSRRGGRRGDDVISRALALPLTVTVAALWGCGAGTPAVPANASPGQKLFTQTGCGSCQVAAFVARASEGTP
jgi:hypothetical protein